MSEEPGQVPVAEEKPIEQQRVDAYNALMGRHNRLAGRAQEIQRIITAELAAVDAEINALRATKQTEVALRWQPEQQQVSTEATDLAVLGAAVLRGEHDERLAELVAE